MTKATTTSCEIQTIIKSFICRCQIKSELLHYLSGKLRRFFRCANIIKGSCAGARGEMTTHWYSISPCVQKLPKSSTKFNRRPWPTLLKMRVILTEKSKKRELKVTKIVGNGQILRLIELVYVFCRAHSVHLFECLIDKWQPLTDMRLRTLLKSRILSTS